MTTRTTSKTITFYRPFWLKGVDRLLPAANYQVVTNEEIIEGLSLQAYRRISTGNSRTDAVWIRNRDADD
jgi:hypothetical protein